MPDGPGVPVRIVFSAEYYTMASLADTMKNCEALLTVGLAQSYELMRPEARASLANSVVIRSVRKGSPLEILLDVQASVSAATSFITLVGGIIALRPLYATAMLKGTTADRKRAEEKLRRRIAADILNQYDDLSKKKRRKLLGNKRFERLVEQAVEGALAIEKVESGDGASVDSSPAFEPSPSK